VLKYLTGYTHRVALSNRRLLSMTDEEVTFSWKDYSANCQHREMTLSGVEFVRRFCLHVLPRRLVRIRHYGLLCNRDRTKRLARCRVLLGMAEPPSDKPAVPSGRLAVGWWLWAVVLLSSGSAELVAAAWQALALASATRPPASCPWCGSCCWETLWQQERRTGKGTNKRKGCDSS
jgi:hypothetical protein